MSTRDSQRSKVYAAEQFVRTLFDRSSERGSRSVEFFGTELTLPPEGRFGSVESVRRYVDSVLNHPAVQQGWPGISPLAVRPRRGVSAAHYERRDGVATIAVPDRRDSWALRELVVLHEIAHHLCEVSPPHGPPFIATLCELATMMMGPEAGYVLRVVYAKEGVRLV